jgi:phosphatidate cytidylyltransferase
MKTRIVSGLLLAPLLVIVYIGGWPLLIGSALIGILCIREFFNGFRKIGVEPSKTAGYISIIVLYAIISLNLPDRYYMLWIFISVLICLLYLFKPNNRQLSDAMATLTGIVYVVFFSAHIVLIDKVLTSDHLVWLVVLSAFGTDTMAYFTGMMVGKHKLCPTISPKKTIEGAIGGILGSILLCGLFGYFFTDGLFVHCLIIGGLGSIAAQLGDLTASIFKRKMGIKDYGNLIPGHGGVLDRFDSILFSAPLVYYYIILVIQ